MFSLITPESKTQTFKKYFCCKSLEPRITEKGLLDQRVNVICNCTRYCLFPLQRWVLNYFAFPLCKWENVFLPRPYQEGKESNWNFTNLFSEKCYLSIVCIALMSQADIFSYDYEPFGAINSLLIFSLKVLLHWNSIQEIHHRCNRRWPVGKDTKKCKAKYKPNLWNVSLNSYYHCGNSSKPIKGGIETSRNYKISLRHLYV